MVQITKTKKPVTLKFHTCKGKTVRINATKCVKTPVKVGFRRVKRQ